MKRLLILALTLSFACPLADARVKIPPQPSAGGVGQDITDDFNRADSGDIGTNWTPVTNQLELSGNKVIPFSGNDACERYSGVTWTDNQSSQVEVTSATGAGAGVGMGPAVRCSASAETYYRAVINGDGQWELGKMVAGSFTSIDTGTTTYSAGAVMKLSDVGTTLTLIYNGSTISTKTDATITSGSPGICYSSAQATRSCDNWRGIDGL